MTQTVKLVNLLDEFPYGLAIPTWSFDVAVQFQARERLNAAGIASCDPLQVARILSWIRWWFGSNTDRTRYRYRVRGDGQIHKIIKTSAKRIAHETGCSRPTVTRILAVLKVLDFIDYETIDPGCHRAGNLAIWGKSPLGSAISDEEGLHPDLARRKKQYVYVHDIVRLALGTDFTTALVLSQLIYFTRHPFPSDLVEIDGKQFMKCSTYKLMNMFGTSRGVGNQRKRAMSHDKIVRSLKKLVAKGVIQTIIKDGVTHLRIVKEGLHKLLDARAQAAAQELADDKDFHEEQHERRRDMEPGPIIAARLKLSARHKPKRKTEADENAAALAELDRKIDAPQPDTNPMSGDTICPGQQQFGAKADVAKPESTGRTEGSDCTEANPGYSFGLDAADLAAREAVKYQEIPDEVARRPVFTKDMPLIIQSDDDLFDAVFGKMPAMPSIVQSVLEPAHQFCR